MPPLIPITSVEAPLPHSCQDSPLHQFLKSTPTFPGLGSICSELGKSPVLLPLSCRVEEGSWYPTVTWFWLQKQLWGLPLSLGPYLLHHLSLFFPPNGTPLSFRLWPFNCKSQAVCGRPQGRATPYIYWLGVGGKEATTREQPYSPLEVTAYSHIFEPSGLRSLCPRPSLKTVKEFLLGSSCPGSLLLASQELL